MEAGINLCHLILPTQRGKNLLWARATFPLSRCKVEMASLPGVCKYQRLDLSQTAKGGVTQGVNQAWGRPQGRPLCGPGQGRGSPVTVLPERWSVCSGSCVRLCQRQSLGFNHSHRLLSADVRAGFQTWARFHKGKCQPRRREVGMFTLIEATDLLKRVHCGPASH